VKTNQRKPASEISGRTRWAILILLHVLWYPGIGQEQTPLPSQAPSQKKPESSGVVRIMTYNIRYDNPDDGIFAWSNRREEFVRFVRSQHLDLFCIQEGLHGQVAFLKNGLTEFEYRGVGRDDGKEEGEYSAIFFNARRFRSLRDGTFWLSPSPETPSKGWDAALPRIVTWVQLCDSLTGKLFFAFNTHFDHHGVRAREQSARLVRLKIQAIAGDIPVVLTGDFNSNESEATFRILVSEDISPILSDALSLSLTPHQGPTSTYTGFEFKEPEEGNRIDVIFVSRGIRVQRHATVIARTPGGGLSDHLPVLAEVIIP
jgi:endonuclease/exonuclease/phosphatase family metal-dependent hydrolase